MLGGEAFTAAQRTEIERAVAAAEAETGFVFSIRIGSSSADSRAFAERLHAQLPDPEHSIFIQVDPAQRSLEIVTGLEVRRVLDNQAAALAAVSMQSALAAGDLPRGVLAGIYQLTALARRPKSLHTDTP